MLRTVPKPRATPVSNFRIPEALKAEARAVADENDETLTDAVIEGLKLYIRDRRRRSSRP